MKRPVFASILAALLAGCLPPGDPPPGNVLENRESIPATPAARREKIITELTAALLMHAPGEPVKLDADAATAEEFSRVWRECSAIAGSPVSADAEWIVRSRLDRADWCVELMKGRQTFQRISTPVGLPTGRE